jgi:hypothetical protein
MLPSIELRRPALSLAAFPLDGNSVEPLVREWQARSVAAAEIGHREKSRQDNGEYNDERLEKSQSPSALCHHRLIG